MKTFLLILAGFILGAVSAVMLAGPVATGVGAGIGIATGLQAGACLTVEAAKEQGFITAEQVADVLEAAGRLIADTDMPPQADGADTELSAPRNDSECAAVVARLQAAGSD